MATANGPETGASPDNPSSIDNIRASLRPLNELNAAELRQIGGIVANRVAEMRAKIASEEVTFNNPEAAVALSALLDITAYLATFQRPESDR